MACFVDWIKKVLCLAAVFCLFSVTAFAQPLEEKAPMSLTAPSALLMEAETGTVIFEKNSDEQRPVASLTKLMTILLVLERLEEGEISLEDQVTVSPNAAAQTGSQALLDAHAVYPLKDLLKATVVASGNDSAVALAEYIAGTEESFVQLMNEKAGKMGLDNTYYKNCTGLPVSGQYTCARDVAIISREICMHPIYFDFSSIWLDTLVHPSGRHTDLTNTNRLVRFYTDCDGLKTGSTNEAKYCLSATAERNGMRLISVVLGVPNSQTRFDEARAMMDYGFATYSRTQVAKAGDLAGVRVPVTMGSRDEVDVSLESGLSMLLKAGQGKMLSFETDFPESVPAPVEKGQVLGRVRILLDDKVVAELNAVAAQDVNLPGLLAGFDSIFKNWK